MLKEFLLHKEKVKEEPLHIQAHLSLPDTITNASQSQKSLLLPTRRETVDYLNAFYIEKRYIENF